MLLGGLWHGASWNFVLWGGLHGLFLMAHRFYRNMKEKHSFLHRLDGNPIYILICFLFTQYWVLLTWIPFRVVNTQDMLYTLKQFIFFDFDIGIVNQGLGMARLFSTLLFLLAFYFIHVFSNFKGGLDTRLSVSRVPVACSLCVVFGFLFFLLWPSKEIPFIYFQF